MTEIIVTIPMSLNRNAVLRQLHGCHDGIAWHYCVNRLPQREPERMHFVHDGQLIGSLPVIGMRAHDGRALRRADGSPLPTPNRRFVILAMGPFREQTPPAPMKGFRGWRYFDSTNARCGECGGLEVVFDADSTERPCPSCAGEAVPA